MSNRIHIDNRVFDVNGKGEEMLRQVLNIAFDQSGSIGCVGWSETKECGLILYWTQEKNINKFDKKMNADEITPHVIKWLESEFAKTVTLSEWCHDCDHDGHNSNGWQVYCGNWGMVNNSHYSICAIKPAFMWHGK